MLKYYAVKGNFNVCFSADEKAKAYCAEHAGYDYKAVREWRYYDPELFNSTTSYSTIAADNLIEAIEQNIIKIMKSMRLYGASGYTLKSVKLVRRDNKVELVVEAWPFSTCLVGYKPEMKNNENLKTATLEILDVTDDEFPQAEYTFEIKK